MSSSIIVYDKTTESILKWIIYGPFLYNTILCGPAISSNDKYGLFIYQSGVFWYRY